MAENSRFIALFFYFICKSEPSIYIFRYDNRRNTFTDAGTVDVV